MLGLRILVVFKNNQIKIAMKNGFEKSFFNTLILFNSLAIQLYQGVYQILNKQYIFLFRKSKSVFALRSSPMVSECSSRDASG